MFEDVIKAVKKNVISDRDIKDVLGKLVEGVELEEALKVEKQDAGDVEEKILKLMKEKPGLSANAYMGLVMKEFQGQIDGKQAMEVIGKLMK